MHFLTLLACLAPLSAPTVGQDPEPKAKASKQTAFDGLIGTQDRRWMARRDMRKVIFESGGKTLLDTYEGTWIWLSGATPEEGLIVPEAERGVGTSALAALSMSGNASGIRAGAQREPFRVLIRALRDQENLETGEVGSSAAPEFVLDQALAVHALAEALITHPGPVMLEHTQKAADALIAKRSADGLWHFRGDAAAPVDAVLCGFAAYALYTAHDADAVVDSKVFQALADWSGKAQPALEDDAGRAAEIAGILCARIFSHQGLGTSLKADPQLEKLAEMLDPYLPGFGVGAEGEGEGAAPELAAANDFTYLASVALYQCDTGRWNRLYRWIKTESIAGAADTVAESTDEAPVAVKYEGFAAGKNGRLPAGKFATTALRILQLQSAVREPALSCFAL